MARKKKTEVEVFEIEEGASKEFKEAMRIYEEEFPPEENVSRETFARSLLEKKEGRFDGAGMTIHLLGVRFSGKMIGMTVCNHFSKLNMGFIEYLCIAPEFQDQGFGRILIKRIIELIKEDAQRIKGENPIGIVFEVIDEEEIDQARLFRSEGAKIIKGIDYVQASFFDGQPIRLGLKVFPLDEEYWNKLNPKKIISIVQTIYEKVYVFKNGRPDEPEFIERFTSSIKPELLSCK